MSVAAYDRLQAIREQLVPPWADDEQRAVETGSFPITVRKRGHRYDLDDRGEAVAGARAASAPRDWLPIAENIVVQERFKVNRRGVVFVQVVEGCDLARIASRLADCAQSVNGALLDAAE